MGGATGAIAAAAARARRRVVSHFLSRGAVSPTTAVGYVPERRLERRFLARLKDAGAVVPARNDTWYVDVVALDAYQAKRRRRVGVVLAGLATAVAAGLGIGLIG